MSSPGSLVQFKEQIKNSEDHDDLSHRFCKDQAAIRDAGVATARCGKTKSGWVPAFDTDMGCVVCYEMFKSGSCAHCINSSKGGN